MSTPPNETARLLDSALNELERVNEIKDGHPTVSHNLRYNIRSHLATLASEGEATDDWKARYESERLLRRRYQEYYEWLLNPFTKPEEKP